MTGITASGRKGIAAVVLLTAGLMAGCSSDGKGAPAWTAEPGTGPATGAASGSAAPSATASASATATAGATAAAWKVFTDPAKTVSFELPQDWIAQSVDPDKGTRPGAVKIEVKDAEGAYLATLQTGLPESSPASCAASARKPYVVVSSVPVELPHSGGQGTIDPHVVFRVIQGYRYFGSYGITNLVGGADSKACQLQNVVQGLAGKGNYSFSDVRSLKSFAPDEKVAPAKAFDTLDQAAGYVNKGSEFANVQRMLMSLEIKS
ncbi:hypothetical protein ARGLB_096_00160 [Arthrobacter globiformis NBRC 12137]|uniref:Lipoprotein n=1 Tax=Arthrobacter globiformis (strain ATCC 8010 / DSM 20124 / JCM 1332 / NBRC 12137 / NCIMB 8907 / NRRL B-2979 / 168) TaxID=1077972 RepID=H0QSZ4_ARTG1|nr:hypothetical protein [Arthrobacter globiformis]GAB15945.1 hypothetical protein ARGLB_096_00160 [Arthrobacter globiformis NBRC 12137]